MKPSRIWVLGAVVALGLTYAPKASATFMVDLTPSGAKMFIDVANKNVSSFKGFVGANNSSAPNIDITTMGNVDTGSGFSNIKPIHGGSLTELTFTPENDTLFSDFSFRGQLLRDAGGVVTLIVQDELGASQTFTFTGLGANADFARQGIISLDGETIKSITLMSDFKEVKQIEFSFKVPDGGTTTMLLGVALTGLGMVGRWTKR